MELSLPVFLVFILFLVPFKAIGAEDIFEQNTQRLEIVQKKTFKYFWDYANPVSGLIRERYHENPSLNDKVDTATIGGTGFGVMAILTGIENNFISREDGKNRILKILDFLINHVPRFNGVYPHWVNANNGQVIRFGIYQNGYEDLGGDIVEHSLLVQGLLVAKEYFNEYEDFELRQMVDKIWLETNWSFYIPNSDQKTNHALCYRWHWNQKQGFSNAIVRGWNEGFMAYFLGLASPTFPISYKNFEECFKKASIKNDDSYLMIKNGGPLFFTHYSFLALDPHFISDDIFGNYFEFNKRQVIKNRNYSILNPKKFKGYGENLWGLTASYSISPYNYLVHEPFKDDVGTISPTGAISSIVYTPSESMAMINYLFENADLFQKIWGDFGFKDAFNFTFDWYSDGYLAIDQGPIIIMIENYKTGLFWKLFMKNQDVKRGVKKINQEN